MRLLMYSQDGLGLGHLRRTHNIARAVLDREPDCKILIVADSPVTPFFPLLPRVDHLKLPTIVKTNAADWQSTLSLEIVDAVSLRANLILEAFRAFSPDVILVDHMPAGALGELKPLLESATGSARRPRLFLGLRDILDTPETVRRVWTGLDAYEHLRHYDSVLIYGSRDLYDAASTYGLTGHARRVAYCNYVTSKPEPTSSSDCESEPLLLVMGGGGHDFFPLATAFLGALPILQQRMQLQSILLTGPNMAQSQREALLAQAPQHAVQILESSEDATDRLHRATAVVTMAGYNSLCEVLAWRKKAVVVPRAGPSAEQRMRTQLFSARQLIRSLDPDTLTPEGLARELTLLLRDERIPEPCSIPPLDGAQRTAALLLARDAEGATVNGHLHVNSKTRIEEVAP